MTIEELTNEMVEELGWAYESDEERDELEGRILNWLSEGGDDGSDNIAKLAELFDEKVGATA